jgi:hypothetical protein
MTAVIALVAGLLFGLGLLLSGMTNPANIIAFLDVTGAWRPSLALTMTAAFAVALPAFTVARIRGVSLRNLLIPQSDRFRIDRPLLLGSTIFGVGWGLSGICPGPGLMLLAGGDSRAYIFVLGVAAGVFAAGRFSRLRNGTVTGDVRTNRPTA